MSAFNEGLMTGASLGQGAYRQRQAREVGGLMTGGNYAGARDAAFGQGDLQTGFALDGRVQQQAETQRQGQITGALQSGDFDAATSFAGSPEELAQITQFRDRASEQERAQAVQQATALAAAIESVQSLPPDQQLAAAQQLAPQFGADPASITPQSLAALPGLRIQAMGLRDFLTHQDRQADNERQQAAFEETQRHNRATEGVSASREARVGRGRSTGGGSGGGAPRAPAPAAGSSRGGALPPGFTIRRR